MASSTNQSSAALNGPLIKAPGLPHLLLVSHNEQLVSQMMRVLRSMFHVSMYYNTMDALSALSPTKPPEVFILGENALEEKGKKLLKAKEDDAYLRTIPMIATERWQRR